MNIYLTLWAEIYKELSVGTLLQNIAFYLLISGLVFLNNLLIKIAHHRKMVSDGKRGDN
jgi:hypothetical protein